MLPERLSTDITSLADQQDRLSIVVEFVVATDGTVGASNIYGAMVRNRAKLAYNSVGAWLAGEGPLPAAAASVPGMDQQLKMQDAVAQALNKKRDERGALEFQTVEVEAVFDGDTLHDVKAKESNRAKDLIANFMIAANGVVARYLDTHNFPSLRRVVKSPERWDRIRVAGGADRRQAAGGCRFRRAGRVSGEAQSRGSRNVPGSVDHGDPAARPRANTSSIRRARSRRATSGWQ